MSEEKLKTLEESNIHLWFEGSPIVLCSMKLVLDIDESRLLAYGKFMNVQPDPISSATFDIICYDSSRNMINMVRNVTYSGLAVERNTEFGYKHGVRINDQRTRNVEFVLRHIATASGTEWTNVEETRFNMSLMQKNLYNYQGDYNKSFLDICANNGVSSTNLIFKPIFGKNFWLCSCGTLNLASETECCDCLVNRDFIFQCTDVEYLKKYEQNKRNNVFDRSEYEKKAAQEKAKEIAELKKRQDEYKKQNQKKKKGGCMSKKLVTLIIVGVLLIALAAGFVLFGLPFINYINAGNEVSNGNYDSAIAAYSQLGDFLDSKDKLLDAKYKKAGNLYISSAKKQAASIFLSLGSYSDSQQRYTQSMYELADEYVKTGKYTEAADIYESTAGYEDSEKKLEDTKELIYTKAEKHMKNKEYSQALSLYKYLGSYKDSETKAKECTYNLANADYNDLYYDKALMEYNSIKDYKDTDSILKKLSALSQIISAAQKNSPAVWSCSDEVCPLCNSKGATYSLAFGADGRVTYKVSCSNHESNNPVEKEYIYRIENDIVYTRNSREKKWQKWLTIRSIDSDKRTVEGKNTSILITNPVTPSKNITMYGNIISEDNIEFS